MRFLVDLMCGGVLTYLRMCGHDASYAGDRDLEADDDVVAAARAESRTVITRDRELAVAADDVIRLDSRDVRDQLAALAAAGVDLDLSDEPTRCGACNGPLERVSPQVTTPGYAPDPDAEPVWRCTDCGQHFWKGSHWDRVRETLDGIDDS